MTTAADRADETAFEAVLAGRPAPAGAAGFTAFTEAVRATATQPGRPSAALAELLANGLLVDQPSPSPRTAVRRRRRMWFFTALIAKIASAGAVAQAATGAGIVLVGFTTAGVTGVLPGPVQSGFDDAVHTITQPGDDGQVAGTSVAPTSTASSTAPTSAVPTETPAAVTPASVTPTSTQGPAWKPGKDAVPSGQNYGQAVSSAAHERNDDRKAGATTTAKSLSDDRDEASEKGGSGQSGRGDD
jgi:hypothetical protein